MEKGFCQSGVFLVLEFFLKKIGKISFLLLERFLACIMFPGNPDVLVPMFVSFRSNEMSR